MKVDPNYVARLLDATEADAGDALAATSVGMTRNQALVAEH
jgi:hypothetical protein